MLSQLSCKLLEAASTDGGATAKVDNVAGVWQDTLSSEPSESAAGPHLESQNDGFEPSSPTAAELMKRKSVGGRIADKLKAFEATKDEPIPPPPPPAPADPIPPPPPPAPVEEVKSKDKSKKVIDIPGSFPAEDEDDPNEILEIIDMSPPKGKKSNSKRPSKTKTDDALIPIPIPPPPPAVPDVPVFSVPPEVIKKDKKERPKINRDGGSSWGMWTASPSRDKDKKSSSKSKPAEEPKRERKERSPGEEEQTSSRGSSSDKAERADKKEKESSAKPKLTSVFASTPPISRATSTRDKRHKEGRSSRRPSLDVNGGMALPVEEVPDMSSKAAKILGIGEGMDLGRYNSKRKQSFRPAEDDDIVIVGASDAEPSPEKSSRRRPSKVRNNRILDDAWGSDILPKQSYPRDDDIVMVEAADVIPTPGLRRSNTTGSSKKGFGGLFGGILSNSRAEPPRRRATYHTDGEDAGPAAHADAEARKAARRARRVEREVADRPRDEARRDKRRRQEEEAEARRQAEKEARRAERKAARAREEETRRLAEEKVAAREERRRQRRTDREREREALADNDAEAEARRARRERHKARARESDRENDEERRRRRAEKRSAREVEAKPRPTRRQTEPAEDDEFVHPRPAKFSRRHTDGLERASKVTAEPPAWPHSGTSSWVKDHSDAGPPPGAPLEDGDMTAEAVDEVDEDGTRRERRRRRRYGDLDVEVTGDRERRKKRREERSDGSDERRRERKGSLFATDGAGVRSSSGFGGLWKKLKGS